MIRQDRNYNQKPEKRIPMWLPYVSEIIPKKRDVYIKYKGGELTRPYHKIHSILFYGAHPDLSQKFLERCAFFEIPIVIHRRNMPQAVWIFGSTNTRKEDYMEKQIFFRANLKKRTHIAKRLLDAKFKSMMWLHAYPMYFKGKYLSLERMRMLEAHHARVYWDKYYHLLGFDEFSRRIKGNELTAALDAVSKFVYGIILRWILYHRLSPVHGYLHEPTHYPALVYDLMEPYRGYIDKFIWQHAQVAIQEKGKIDNWTALALKATEMLMDQKVYTSATKQIVTFQELLHGAVLALRAYLDGSAQRFIVPIPDKPNGGRPRKTGYMLYGRSAGPTDFWSEAKELGRIYAVGR